MNIKLDKKNSEPLYQQLEKQLTLLIRKKQKGCQKILSENFLAETCGISRMTARQALMNLERRAFIYRIPGKGTFIREELPDAQPSPSAQKKTVTVFLSTFNSKKHPFFIQLLSGIEHQARMFDLSVSLSADFTKAHKDKSTFGIILLSKLPIEEIKNLENNKTPFVLLYNHAETYGVSYPSVLLDGEQAIFTATEHLLRLGHTKIALFSGVLKGYLKGEGSRKRLTGYKKALEKWHIPFDASLVMESDYDEEKTRAMTMELISRQCRPTAAIACDDIGAGIIINTLKDAGISIPGDVAVLGVGDIHMNSVISPPLTTVRFPTFEYGEKAVVCLQQISSGTNIDSPLLVEGNLIIRKSCGWDNR